MPRKNTRNRTESDLQHVYNRGRNRRPIFRDDEDRDHFMDRLKIAIKRSEDAVRLISACAMTTHFHLVSWEREPLALPRMMNSLINPYVKWFNAKHGVSGPMFPGPYRTVPIVGKSELRWKIAYVHDNHPDGPAYPYSTHRYFVDGIAGAPSWLDVRTGLSAFGGVDAYLDYMSRRERRKALNADFFG